MNYSLSRFTIVSSLVCLGFFLLLPSRAIMVMGKRREKNYQSHQGRRNVRQDSGYFGCLEEFSFYA